MSGRLLVVILGVESLNFASMVAQGRLLERDGGLGVIECKVFRFVAQV